MPTYEYACRDCGERLEVVQSFSDDALTVCPSCDGSLRKVFSAAGIIFKGSGWHIKDYAGKGAATADPGNGSSAKDDAASKKSADKDGSSTSKAAGTDTSTASSAKSGTTSSSSDSGSSSKAGSTSDAA